MTRYAGGVVRYCLRLRRVWRPLSRRALIRYDTQYEPFYEVGPPFPVYYVAAHPELSYGPNPPRQTLFMAVECYWHYFRSGYFLRAATITPNHAMQRTAGYPYAHILIACARRL